jgi:hypothetical protein
MGDIPPVLPVLAGSSGGLSTKSPSHPPNLLSRDGSTADPTRILVVTCLSAMTTLYLFAFDWDVSLALLNIYLNPYPILVVRIALAMTNLRSVMHSAISLKTDNDTTSFESVLDPWIAEWYWWNAWLLHVAMKVNFTYWAVTSPTSSTTSSGVTTVRSAELMIMYPLYLAATCAIMRQSPIRF